MSAHSKIYGEDRDCLEQSSLSSQQPCQITPAKHWTCDLDTYQPRLLHSACSLQQSSCPAREPPQPAWALEAGASMCHSHWQPWGNISHRSYWDVWLIQGFPGFFHVWWGHSIHSPFFLTAPMSPYVVAYCLCDFILFITLLFSVGLSKRNRSWNIGAGWS